MLTDIFRFCCNLYGVYSSIHSFKWSVNLLKSRTSTSNVSNSTGSSSATNVRFVPDIVQVHTWIFFYDFVTCFSINSTQPGFGVYQSFLGSKQALEFRYYTSNTIPGWMLAGCWFWDVQNSSRMVLLACIHEVVSYVCGFIMFAFRVLQLLLLRFTLWNLWCCITYHLFSCHQSIFFEFYTGEEGKKSMMDHLERRGRILVALTLCWLDLYCLTSLI